MGYPSKSVAVPPPPGVLYWLFRSLLCVVVAPVLGILFGALATFVGIHLGEAAALLMLAISLAWVFLMMVQARRRAGIARRKMAGVKREWDPEFDQ